MLCLAQQNDPGSSSSPRLCFDSVSRNASGIRGCEINRTQNLKPSEQNSSFAVSSHLEHLCKICGGDSAALRLNRENWCRHFTSDKKEMAPALRCFNSVPSSWSRVDSETSDINAARLRRWFDAFQPCGR